MHLKSVRPYRHILLFVVLLCGGFMIQAQSKPKFEFDMYGEFYYGFDDLRQADHNRPSFVYNHSRTEELALNLALLHGSLTDSLWRMKAGIMSGTYVARNLAGEAPVMRNVYEAFGGLRLRSRNDIWLEAGIFPSHIGFETVIGSENPTLTRSIIAENSPYYESGVRLTWQSKSKKWSYLVAMLNGWQRMNSLDGLYPPSMGIQIKYDPSPNWSFNYSNYLGDINDEADLSIRHFHDIFINYRSNKGLQIVLSVDFGAQPDLQTDEWEYKSWYGGLLMASLPIANKWRINGRLEQYVDQEEIFVSNFLDDGFNITGYSFGADYIISKNAMVRMEAKRLDSSLYSFISEEDDMTNVMHLFNAALTLRFP